MLIIPIMFILALLCSVWGAWGLTRSWGPKKNVSKIATVHIIFRTAVLVPW